VKTVRVMWDKQSRLAHCVGDLQTLGGAEAVEVGFQYRDVTGLDTHERQDNWQTTPLTRRTAPGEVSLEVSGLQSGRRYEFRCVGKHSVLTVFGSERVLKTQ